LGSLNNFSDAGEFGIYAHFGLGMVENLAIDAFATFDKVANVDMAMAFGASAMWSGFGGVRPRLTVAYGKGAGPYAFRWDSQFDAWEGSDQSFLSFTPEVQFRARSNAYVDVGAVIGIDLGNVSAYRNFGASDTGITFGAFVDFRVSF
jgi:hypothetical protein